MRRGLVSSLTQKSKFRLVFIFFLVFQIAMVLLIPPMISHDGYNYLSSGKALFSPDFPYRYQLMREPLYPFLVWLASRTGNVLLTLSLIQSFLMSISATILFRIFIKKFKTSEMHTLISITIGLFAVRGYASTVLQICLIIVILLLSLLNLFWLIDNQHLKYRSIVSVATTGALAAATNSALTCTVIGSLILGLWLANVNWKRIIKLVTYLLIGSASVLVPWYSITFPVDIYSQAILSPHTSFELKYFERTSFIEDNKIRLQAIGSLLLIYPDRAPGYSEGYSMPAKELMMFGSYWDYGKTGNCLINHGGQTESVDYVMDEIRPRCVKSKILDFQRTASHLVVPIYLFSGIFLIAALITSLRRKCLEMQLFVMPMIILILIYGSGGAGISRFSAILPFVGPSLALWLIKEFTARKDSFLG